MVLIYWFKKTFDLAANMAAQNIKIWKKFRIKIFQVAETKTQWKKKHQKEKGIPWKHTSQKKKNSCIRDHRRKRIRAKSSTTDYKSKQKKKKINLHTKKKQANWRKCLAKTFGALTTQFQINYLFFELETGGNNGGMKKKNSIRINRPDWAP